VPQFLFRTINNNKIKEVPLRAATFFKNARRKISLTPPRQELTRCTACKKRSSSVEVHGAQSLASKRADGRPLEQMFI
jgi:hypothetical protein